MKWLNGPVGSADGSPKTDKSNRFRAFLMPPTIFQKYRHSGKFGAHGPLLYLLVAGAVGFPLGLIYAYATTWLPFVYMNFLITVGYGALVGVIGIGIMKRCRVRNTAVTAIGALASGLVVLYFVWSAHVHVTYKGAPILSGPDSILEAMRNLYAQGSWSLKGTVVTGIPLAIIWAVEALIILGMTTLVAATNIADTPYCEENQCWLDEEKTIDTVSAFTDPEQLDRLKQGDLGPLTQAQPKATDALKWTRLTLKHSAKCQVFCTVRLSEVTRTVNAKEGTTHDRVLHLTGNLILPHESLALLTRFEGFGKKEGPTQAAA
jgi:hypothetical protein